MRRWLPSLLGLLLVQALLVAGWFAVEARRDPTPSPEPAMPSSVSFEPATGPVPALRFTRRDGSVGSLSQGSDRVIVHFWATWCPPCIEELPSLLRWSERSGTELLAVTVDPTWDPVQRFFGGPPPPAVVQADAEAARRWGASGLPTTFVVQGSRIVSVARGPVDWSDPGLPSGAAGR